MVDKSNLRARALVLRDILRKPPVADNVPAGSDNVMTHAEDEKVIQWYAAAGACFASAGPSLCSL